MKSLNYQAAGLKESVFSTITQLANKHQAINLAQGFPDFDGPDFILELATHFLRQNKNQYAPSYGTAALKEAIAANYVEQYNLIYDPAKEILVTNGATEAIYCTIQALINPGDEVVVFEPFYDSYAAAVEMAKGVLKPVTLNAPDFNFEIEQLKANISDKTKLLILNNPHNPTSRVFTNSELKIIAELAIKHDFYILSDEVYEYLSFENSFTPTANLYDLKDRVITISSIGKTLSLTGWKIGWVCAPEALTKIIHNVHQFVSFCVAHPLQMAVAESFKKFPQYLQQFRSDYSKRKILLIDGLKTAGFKVLPSQGTYFVTAQVPTGFTDWSYSQYLIENSKVATIPMSPFYLKSKQGENLIRFCFAKKEETLMQAIANLKHQ